MLNIKHALIGSNPNAFIVNIKMTVFWKLALCLTRTLCSQNTFKSAEQAKFALSLEKNMKPLR